MPFVSRAGQKLDHAIATFGLDVTGLVCADFGSNTGGFVDCLLQRGAAKVFAIDTGYGTLEWKLRKDPRVIVMERTNAIHVELPERVDLISIDVAWTKQRIILPAANRSLKPDGRVITLIKPHYEADAKLLRKGILPVEAIENVVNSVQADFTATGFAMIARVASPITGTGGNHELLALLQNVNK